MRFGQFRVKDGKAQMNFQKCEAVFDSRDIFILRFLVCLTRLRFKRKSLLKFLRRLFQFKQRNYFGASGTGTAAGVVDSGVVAAGASIGADGAVGVTVEDEGATSGALEGWLAPGTPAGA